VPHAEAGETPALPWRGDAGDTERFGATERFVGATERFVGATERF